MIGNPPHGRIGLPHTFHIQTMVYETRRIDREADLDLHLRRGDVIRRLRFYSPQDFQIEKGFPEATSGMMIQDVQALQMDRLGVRVIDFEASWGSITVWARDVVDLDTMGAVQQAAATDGASRRR